MACCRQRPETRRRKLGYLLTQQIATALITVTLPRGTRPMEAGTLGKVMDPSTLEMFLMLRVNKHMWGEETLQNIIDKNKAAAREKAIVRSKR